MAVNVRLAQPDEVADLAIDHFDGLETSDDLWRDGRCARDLWFYSLIGFASISAYMF
jgi:hypothetical protein